MNRWHLDEHDNGYTVAQIVNFDEPCWLMGCPLEHVIVMPEPWYRHVITRARSFDKLEKVFAHYGLDVKRKAA